MKEKKSRSNVNKPILILGISFVVIGCTLGVSSLAWFIRPTTTQKVDGVDGAAVGSYFAGGDGKTAETAYQIETPKQLYYFNWLQDPGYFNKKKKDASGNETSDYEQVYFVLNNDIDADGYYLPPAGTTKYPFIGNFNGAGYKISNLTISNNEDNLKKTGWPSGADSNVKGSISIVGFFGIVGEYESDAEVTGYTVEVNEVKDLYFDYLTVETNTDQTLVGLIAGYANGQLTNCGVRSGYFDFQNANVSVINSGALADNDKLSQHSLIGAYNSNHFDYKGKPGGSGSDTSGSWGGSIDIASLAKRITYIAAAKGMTAGSATKAYDMTERFKANIYYYSTPFTWDTTKDLGQSVNLQNGTCLPLNIDLDKATISSSYIDTEDIGTYYTKGSNTGEPVSDSNTGYLVGRGGDGTISSSNATPRLYNKGMNLNSSSETKKTEFVIRYTYQTKALHPYPKRIGQKTPPEFTQFSDTTASLFSTLTLWRPI